MTTKKSLQSRKIQVRKLLEKEASLSFLQLREVSELFLRVLLDEIQGSFPSLVKKGPFSPGLQWQVHLRFVSVTVMRQWKGRFLGQDRATDILSFPAPPLFVQQGHLGECVICWEVLKRQAKEWKHSTQVEWIILLVHGVLHLLGLDHERSEKEAQVMRRWEKRLLNHLFPSVSFFSLIHRSVLR